MRSLNKPAGKTATGKIVLRVAISGMTFIALTMPVFAQSCAQGGAADMLDRKFSSVAGELVNQALSYGALDEFEAQKSSLLQVLYHPELSAYERGVIYQMMGAAHYELNDYTGAIKAFEDAQNSGGLTAPECRQIELNIAQLLISDRDYTAGAQRLEHYLKAYPEEYTRFAPMLIGFYTGQKDYLSALDHAQRNLTQSNPRTQQHYETVISLQALLGRVPAAEHTRREMKTDLAQQVSSDIK